MVSPAAEETMYKLAGSLPNNVLAKPSVSYGPAQQILKWASTPGFTFVSPADMIRANPETTFDKLTPEVVAGQSSLKDALNQVQSAQDQLPALP